MTALIPRTVEVFNADYRTFGHVPWTEAVKLILRGVVNAVEFHSPSVHIHSPSHVIELPSSVVLIQYAHRPYRPHPEGKATREAILVRDKHTCAFCGGKASTIDHVMPRSRGGGDTWLNLVAACETCNGRKADKTPEEAGMPLLWHPYEPREKDKFSYAG